MDDTSAFAKLFHDYGWLGASLFLLLIIMRETLPSLAKTFFPARFATIRRREEAAESERRRKEEVTEAERQDERRHRQLMEERQVKAMEEIAQSQSASRLLMEAMRVLLDTTNKRLERLEVRTEFASKGIAVLLDREGLTVNLWEGEEEERALPEKTRK